MNPWNVCLCVCVYYMYVVPSHQCTPTWQYINFIILILLVALQSLVDFSLFQNCCPVSNFRSFSTKHFLWGGVVSPTPNPQSGGLGYPYLSGSSSLTCLAWEALPVATLPPA
jgi:hypothetical protein